MRFTRRTYRTAIRRARKVAAFEYSQHCAAFCGTERVIRAEAREDALIARRIRERGAK